MPMGTKVPVRTEETIDSATAAEGQTYAAEIADAGAPLLASEVGV